MIIPFTDRPMTLELKIMNLSIYWQRSTNVILLHINVIETLYRFNSQYTACLLGIFKR